jgi:hypothetical protein
VAIERRKIDLGERSRSFRLRKVTPLSRNEERVVTPKPSVFPATDLSAPSAWATLMEGLGYARYGARWNVGTGFRRPGTPPSERVPSLASALIK